MDTFDEIMEKVSRVDRRRYWASATPTRDALESLLEYTVSLEKRIEALENINQTKCRVVSRSSFFLLPYKQLTWRETW